jgi:hypothetical protein
MPWLGAESLSPSEASSLAIPSELDPLELDPP